MIQKVKGTRMKIAYLQTICITKNNSICITTLMAEICLEKLGPCLLPSTTTLAPNVCRLVPPTQRKVW